MKIKVKHFFVALACSVGISGANAYSFDASVNVTTDACTQYGRGIGCDGIAIGGTSIRYFQTSFYDFDSTAPYATTINFTTWTNLEPAKIIGIFTFDDFASPLNLNGTTSTLQLHFGNATGVTPLELRLTLGSGFYYNTLDSGTYLTESTVLRSFTDTSAITAPVPEPETCAMLLAGLGIMGFVARRRSKVG